MDQRIHRGVVAAAMAMSAVMGSVLPFRQMVAAVRQSPANVQVSRDRYPGHGMPALAANPRDPRNLLGVAKLFTRGGHFALYLRIF